MQLKVDAHTKQSSLISNCPFFLMMCLSDREMYKDSTIKKVNKQANAIINRENQQSRLTKLVFTIINTLARPYFCTCITTSEITTQDTARVVPQRKDQLSFCHNESSMIPIVKFKTAHQHLNFQSKLYSGANSSAIPMFVQSTSRA